MTYISPNFSLFELCKSEAALRLGLDNTPDNQSIKNLQILATNVLEPIRAKFGGFSPNSCYRSYLVNKAIGGATNSQHTKGQAADIEISGMSNYDLAVWCSKNIRYDQIILEMASKSDPRAGWVHVSYSNLGNRKQLLTIYSKSSGGATVNGLIRP